MIELHVPWRKLDTVLEHIRTELCNVNTLSVKTVEDYIIFRKLTTVANMNVRYEGDVNDIVDVVELQHKVDIGEATREDTQRLSQLKKKLRNEYVSTRDFEKLRPLLMCRVVYWDDAFRILTCQFRELVRNFNHLSTCDVLYYTWIYAKYHLHQYAKFLLKRLVQERELTFEDRLRVLCLILFNIMELTARKFNMFTVKIHDVLNYFTWVVYVREGTKYRELLALFKSCDRYYAISNGLYVTDQARISTSIGAPTARVHDVYHVFTIQEQRYKIHVVASCEDEQIRVRLHSVDSILKSQNIDTKLTNVNIILDVVEGDLLLVMGNYEIEIE